MKKVIIDCGLYDNRQQLHNALAEALQFPEWYGHNLDALHDCLTAISEETTLTLTDFDSLPFVTTGFCRVLQDAQEENPNLKVTLL